MVTCIDTHVITALAAATLPPLISFRAFAAAMLRHAADVISLPRLSCFSL